MAAESILALLFDVDGTLITSGGAGAKSWTLAFDDLYGIPADIGQFTEGGMTEPEVGRLTFKNVIGREPTREELAKVMSRRLKYLPKLVAESEGFKVEPGVRETLDRLSHAGFLLGITTGGMEAAAHIKLARADLNHYFCFGGYGSDSADRVELTRRAIERAETLIGEKLDPRETMVIGDTPHDIDAAKGVGAVSVGVATGKFSVDQLRDAGAQYALETLEDELPVGDVPAERS